MPTKARTHNPLSALVRRQLAQAKGREERADDPHRHLYAMPEWRDARTGLRAMQIAIEPTCRECREIGVVSAATEVDHIVPHRGDMRLFLDASNLQSLCKPHHSMKTARENQ